jgi:DNA polymerase III delta subunit
MQFTEGAVVESSTFKLLDAINDKDTNRSIRILENLLRLENNPSQILGLLGWHITRLIMVKRLLINKMPRDQMLSYLGVGNYLLNKLISQAEDLSLSQLKRHLESLVDTDLMLKTSGVKGEFGLEALVVRLSS